MANQEAGIYIITNRKNGKVYIGSTAIFSRRWGDHKRLLRRERHHNPHLQSAWNKYGEDAFEFGVLEYLDNPEELHLAEQFWMDVYREEGAKLYNYGPARASRLGQHHSAETKATLSEMNTGENNPSWGKHCSEETKRKIGSANRGHVKSEGLRQRMSKARKGRYAESHRLKVSKPYPAFIHRETGEVIPAGVNLAALCRRRELDLGNMRGVMHGQRRSCQGWATL